MLNIAIVEDMAALAEQLKGLLRIVLDRMEEKADIRIFGRAEDMLPQCKRYDIIFMDIELPGMNGMAAAHVMRDSGNDSVIIFVTNFTGFATEGFLVNATDYIIKPFNVNAIEMALSGALRLLKSKRKATLSIPLGEGVCVFDSSEIIYIETYGHKMIFYAGDETRESWGSLKEVEQKLQPYGFVRIHRSYLVNMRYITGVSKNFVRLGETQLPVSAKNHQTLMRRLNEYFS